MKEDEEEGGGGGGGGGWRRVEEGGGGGGGRKRKEEDVDQWDDWMIDQSEETSHYIRGIAHNQVISILTVKQ